MSDDCQTPEFPENEKASKPIVVLIWQYISRVTIGVLRLRRVQLALTTIIVSLLIMWFPHLEGLRDDLLMLMAAILMVAVGGYSVTDAFYHGQPDTEHLEDLLEAVADELGIDVDALEEHVEEVQDAKT